MLRIRMAGGVRARGGRPPRLLDSPDMMNKKQFIAHQDRGLVVAGICMIVLPAIVGYATWGVLHFRAGGDPNHDAWRAHMTAMSAGMLAFMGSSPIALYGIWRSQRVTCPLCYVSVPASRGPTGPPVRTYQRLLGEACSWSKGRRQLAGTTRAPGVTARSRVSGWSNGAPATA